MKISRSQLRQIIKEEIQRVHEEEKIEESTFVAAYNGSRGVFAHEFKAKDIKDALQRFINICTVFHREKRTKLKLEKQVKDYSVFSNIPSNQVIYTKQFWFF